MAVTASSLLLAVLAAPVASASAHGVLTTTVVFPGGIPASGAEVRLTVGRANEPERELAVAVADARGSVAFDVPETGSLVARASSEGGRLRTVLVSTARQGTDDAPLYFKRVATVWLTLDPESKTFTVPAVGVQFLRTMPEFDRTLVAQLGEQTLAQVGELADMTLPWLLDAKARLDAEMASRGYLFENEAVAYNIHTADGMLTWLTYAPEQVVVRPTGEVGVYEVLPLSTMGLPAVDTTDAGDAADDLSTAAAAKERGRWGKHSSDCFFVAGPDAEHPRYQRTVCWQLDHQVMDTYKGRSYWQFHMDASGTAMSGDRMARLWVHSQPWWDGGAPQQYRDGQSAPTATYSSTEGCTTRSHELSIASGEPVKVGAAYSWARTSCETYGPRMFQNAGQHASNWWGNDDVGANTYRYVALKTPVFTVTSQGTPLWSPWSGQWVG
ncbi:MAG TPA: hypothetical protein VNQ77_17500 [Frankiaceae bacterium]|nr:hypothetical protein [Frankiaceae bacterium]